MQHLHLVHMHISSGLYLWRQLLSYSILGQLIYYFVCIIVKILSHRHEILEPYLPYNIDYGTGIENPLMNNLFHLSVWAIAHSTFARHSVKVYITKIIPRHLERPFYVFQSSYLLHNGKNHQLMEILINFQ